MRQAHDVFLSENNSTHKAISLYVFESLGELLVSLCIMTDHGKIDD